MNNTTYKYIDLDQIKEYTFGDLPTLKMLLELFIQGIDEFVNDLNKEVNSQNLPELFQAAHKIKPNISMFGIDSLEDPILELESCFRNEENLHKVDALTEKVVQTLKEVKKEIHIELKTLSHE